VIATGLSFLPAPLVDLVLAVLPVGENHSGRQLRVPARRRYIEYRAIGSVDEKTVDRIGWFASFMAIAMYFSYIDQIRLNISGHPGSIILPIITVINGCVWTTYGFLEQKKDWPIIACNIPAIVLGVVTATMAVLN